MFWSFHSSEKLNTHKPHPDQSDALVWTLYIFCFSKKTPFCRHGLWHWLWQEAVGHRKHFNTLYVRYATPTRLELTGLAGDEWGEVIDSWMEINTHTNSCWALHTFMSTHIQHTNNLLFAFPQYFLSPWKMQRDTKIIVTRFCSISPSTCCNTLRTNSQERPGQRWHRESGLLEEGWT